MTSPTYGGSGTQASGNTVSSLAPGRPVGMTDGDSYMTMVAGQLHHTVPGITINVPAGWTELHRVELVSGTTTLTVCLFGKVADPADGSTFTVTSTAAGQRFHAQVHWWNGVDLTTPVDTGGAAKSGNAFYPTTTSLVVPSVTPDGTLRTLVLPLYFVANSSTRSANVPTGMTGADNYTGAVGHKAVIAYQELATADPTGDKTVTFSGLVYPVGGLLNLRGRSVSGGTTVEVPTAGSVTFTAETPSLSVGNSVSPAKVTATWQAHVPEVSTAQVSISPAAVEVTWTAEVPTVVAAASVVILPGTVSVTWRAYPAVIVTPEPVRHRTGAGVEIRILHRDDWTEVFKYVPRSNGVRWIDELEGPGYGELKISGDDRLLMDGFSEFAVNNLIAIYVDGLRVFTWKIERRVFDEINEGEDAGAWWTISGAGLKAGLQGGVVYPEIHDVERGIHRLAADNRAFTFAAKNYDESTNAWTSATQVKQAGNMSAPFANAPTDWPDPDAWWITSPLTSHEDEDFQTSPDARVVYFRSSFPLDRIRTVTVFAAAAGQAEVFIDGALELETDGHRRTGSVELRLPPGEHTVAARYRVGSSGSGFLLSIGNERGEGSETPEYDWLLRTSSSWSALHNVKPPPGFTPGRIIRLLVEEFLERAAHTEQPSFFEHLGLDFSDDADSNGDAWEELTDRYWQVGTDYLAVLMEICESAAESYITPYGNLKLYTTERGQDVSDTVKLLPGHNIVNMSHDTQGGLGNHIVGRYDSGWTEKHRQGQNRQGGLTWRREVFLSVGTADSATEARRLMGTALVTHGGQRRVTSCTLISKPGAKPYVDFKVGDYVAAWDVYDQALVPQRVVALSGQQDEDGELVYVPELVIP